MVNNIEQLRQAIGYRILAKQAYKLNRVKTFHNFDSAKTIGLLFNATDQNKYNEAKQFFNYLSERKLDIWGLGYLENKEAVNLYPYMKGVNYFSLIETNWYRKPTNEKVQEFINQPLDILIDISLFENIVIQYIMGLSKAKFKISKTYKRINYSDFMIDIPSGESLPVFIDQIKHYMNTIIKN